jgi:hypothetical protein
LTHAANPRFQADYFLQPGEDSTQDIITYAPANRFNRLTLSVSALYTKDLQPIGATMAFNSQGIAVFQTSAASNDVMRIETPLASLDLTA